VANADTITIDGQFGDWDDVPAAWSSLPRATGMHRLKITSDEVYLYFYVEVTGEGGAELDLSEDNDLVLLLDTDVDLTTGVRVKGSGNDVLWAFAGGDHRSGGQGALLWADGARELGPAAIGFVAAPTVTSPAFEMRIDRRRLAGLGEGAIGVALEDGASGQRAPASGRILHTLGPIGERPLDDRSMQREQPDDIRLVSLNCEYDYDAGEDSMWQADSSGAYRRLFAAAAGDVICLQEIHDHTPDDVVTLLSSLTPEATSQWSAVASDDCVIASRFPIRGSWTIRTDAVGGGNCAALLATKERLGRDLLVINMHLACCAKDDQRQHEVDAIIEFLRDVRLAGRPFTIEPGTPIVLLGDTNFVGDAQQLQTVLTGDIVQEGQYGNDFALDVDGSSLAAVEITHFGSSDSWTWRDDTSRFWPGRLDYVFLTDSVLETGTVGAVMTETMSPQQLNEVTLNADDWQATDHLMLITDIRDRGPLKRSR
jgi:endonuclease/exonuclease/phosphatase family metal-dependent hydrolase